VRRRQKTREMKGGKRRKRQNEGDPPNPPPVGDSGGGRKNGREQNTHPLSARNTEEEGRWIKGQVLRKFNGRGGQVSPLEGALGEKESGTKRSWRSIVLSYQGGSHRSRPNAGDQRNPNQLGRYISGRPKGGEL